MYYRGVIRGLDVFRVDLGGLEGIVCGFEGLDGVKMGLVAFCGI